MPQRETTVQSILDQVRWTYATCATYQDLGEVVDVTINGPRDWDRSTCRRTFQTCFERSGKFRFNFNLDAKYPTYVVWSDSVQFRSWTTLHPGIELHESLDHALAGPTGVSSGSARAIPSMLRKDLVWIPLMPEASRTQLVVKEVLDDRECFVLESSGRPHGPGRFWIDSEQFLIRQTQTIRVFNKETQQRSYDAVRNDPSFPEAQKREYLAFCEEHESPDFSVDSIMHFQPRINAPVDPANWSFEPPF